ncbi:hypothetical protein KY290_033499 [Solanum tuberosum]|uniref:Retrotransposon gag domain-containing protein n=1 Tax=Solanum tuberosum TaxID=4113 RepID=A0ABQ7U0G8_SOLTU|nr:hypothetical protein KY289_032857 [Solanum tuberosum]KAH0647503.1 hypothetical protein KY285_032751 [Solanum tuberosum]KAH0740456.1 hypothetical protein KY290_033499 [Solanum tuberosum]
MEKFKQDALQQKMYDWDKKVNGRLNPKLVHDLSRLVVLGNNEALLMRLFIQSLSGIAFAWYVKQDFGKWLAWKDMTRDYVEKCKFNNKDDPTMLDLIEKLEASKIHHSPYEEELVQTLIRSLNGIYPF